MLEEDEEVELKMDPNTEKKPLLSRLLQPSSPRLKVAFIYEKRSRLLPGPMPMSWGASSGADIPGGGQHLLL